MTEPSSSYHAYHDALDMIKDRNTADGSNLIEPLTVIVRNEAISPIVKVAILTDILERFEDATQ